MTVNVLFVFTSCVTCHLSDETEMPSIATESGITLVVVVWSNSLKLATSKCALDPEVMAGVVSPWCNVGWTMLIEVVNCSVEWSCLVSVESAVVIESVVRGTDGVVFSCGMSLTVVLTSPGMTHSLLTSVCPVVDYLGSDSWTDHDDWACDSVCEGPDTGTCTGEGCDGVSKVCKSREDWTAAAVSFVHSVCVGMFDGFVDSNGH